MHTSPVDCSAGPGAGPVDRPRVQSVYHYAVVLTTVIRLEFDGRSTAFHTSQGRTNTSVAADPLVKQPHPPLTYLFI